MPFPRVFEPIEALQASSAEAVLRSIRAADKGQLAVSEEDGRFLRVLVASNRTKRALEIGAASGYSAIWIGLGLRETGGRLVTIEYDAARAGEAAANVRRAAASGHHRRRHRYGFGARMETERRGFSCRTPGVPSGIVV